MEEERKKNRRVTAGLLAIGALTFLTTLFGTTFAYFTASVNNSSNTETVINAAKVAISYSDGQQVSYSNVVPGWAAVKTVSVSSTSTFPITYTIKWDTLTTSGYTNLEYTVYKVSSTASENTTAFPTVKVVGPTGDVVFEDGKVYTNPSLTYSFGSANYASSVTVNSTNASAGSAIASNTSSVTIPETDGTTSKTDTYYIVFRFNNIAASAQDEEQLATFTGRLAVDLSQISGLNRNNAN